MTLRKKLAFLAVIYGFVILLLALGGLITLAEVTGLSPLIYALF